MQRKTVIMEQLENKLDAGLERAIVAIVSWVKLHLQTEQKKTDFKPEGDIDTLASSVSGLSKYVLGCYIMRTPCIVQFHNTECSQSVSP